MANLFQPAIVRFPKNSCIVVEGKTNTERFFIIQKGKVLISRKMDGITGQTDTIAGPGDIFGAVSSLASYSYIETAIALTNVTLLSVAREQYGDLIRSQASIALKIIQQFSERLRGLDDMFAYKALNSGGKHEPSHLYQVAEFYYNQDLFDQAFYAYQQYLNYCPQGEYAEEITLKMNQIVPKVSIRKPEYPEDQLERTYPKNSLIFAEGEYGNELYIIQSGSVKITKIANNQEIVIAFLKRGEIFGEMAALEKMPRTSTVEVYEECTVYVINQIGFMEMIKDKPNMAARITALIAERILFAYKQIAVTHNEDPLGRIYDALVVQLQKDRVSLDAKTAHLCNFGFKELLGMAGLSYKDNEKLILNLLASKHVSQMGDKVFIPNASNVYRQAHFYKKKLLR